MGLRGAWVVAVRVAVGALGQAGALGGEGLAEAGAEAHQLVSLEQQRWMQTVGMRKQLLLLLLLVKVYM
jgi:hypothetical protein